MDVFDGKDADADLVQDGPLSGLAVGIARVVNEPRHIARVRRIDHLVVFYLHDVGAR